jgi:hypothetical protein
MEILLLRLVRMMVMNKKTMMAMIMVMNIYFQGHFKWEFDFLDETVSGFLRI